MSDELREAFEGDTEIGADRTRRRRERLRARSRGARAGGVPAAARSGDRRASSAPTRSTRTPRPSMPTSRPPATTRCCIVGITGAALLAAAVPGLLRHLPPARPGRTGCCGTRRRARRCWRPTLRRSEERFRSLVHNSADIIAVLDVDGRRAATSALRSNGMLGYPAADRVGHPLLELVHPDDLERARPAADRGIQGTPAEPGVRRAPRATPRRQLAGHRRGGHRPAGGSAVARHRAQLP